MAWLSGTGAADSPSGAATDYRDLLSELKDVALGDIRLATVATYVANGTGYAIGDLLKVDGGTFTHECVIRVTAVSGGGVTAAVVHEGGAYSVSPGPGTLGTTKLTGAGNNDFTLTATFDTGQAWILDRYLKQIGLTVAILNADGTGYAANDVITIDSTGGTYVTESTITVDTVDTGGEILTFHISDPGEYSVAPTNVVANAGTVSPAGGTGATFDLIFQGRVGEDELIMHGVGSGAEKIYVGARTYSDTGLANWELAGFTGHSEASDWESQPGISPGRFGDTPAEATGGAYVPLRDASTCPWWISINTRRIVLISNPGANWSSLYMGFLAPFATTTEFPYPLYIAGSTSNPLIDNTTSTMWYSSIIDPISAYESPSYQPGPGWFRLTSGSWQEVVNGQLLTSRSPRYECVVYPAGNTITTPSGNPAPLITAVDRYFWDDTAEGLSWNRFIPASGVPGNPERRWMRSLGDNEAVLVPATVILSDKDGMRQGVFGELEGVYWLDATGQSAGDFTDKGTQRYFISQSGARSEAWIHFCVRQL